jgi:uncharacterized protein (TIGR02594 family)
MRLVTMSTALVLSIAALSLSTPASAVSVKDDFAAKTQAKKPSVAKYQPKIQPKKQAVTKLQPKKPAVTKLLPGKQSVAKQKRAPSAEAIKRTQRKVRHVRPETAESAPTFRMPRLFAFADPVSEARRWIGSNPTDRDTLWCARFMNFVLERTGYQGTGSDAAKSFASYGQRVSGPQVGAIAVMTRGKSGGHVGIVSGVDPSGNPIIISGNHGHRVGEGVYPRGRVYAYVLPK